jgi:glycosyltransferase involved in cell wall biosynthesis
MRIGLLSYEYPKETGFGGIGSYTWYQARALVKLGHEVHVLAGSTAPTALRSDDHDGVRVHRYRWGGPIRRALEPSPGKPWLAWTRNRVENGLNMYLGLKELCRGLDFDVLEMPECGAEGLLVNRWMRIPAVVRFHSPARLIMESYGAPKTDRILCSALEKFGFKGAGGYTAGSRFLAAEVEPELGRGRSVSVIPNGIDVELFDAEAPFDARERFDLPRDRPIIFFCGRMERRKGAHLLKEIVPPILARHDAVLVLAGRDLFRYAENELLPYLRSHTRADSVRFLGRLDAAEVRSCLRQADIFLLPSLWENCPYACLEAMAAGRAIVSSDAGGLPELIRDGENGLLAPREDAGSYVRCLERLIEDRGLRERLGDAARRSVAFAHTDVKVAEASVARYRALLEGT